MTGKSKSRKTKRRVENLPTKPLGVQQARSVRGGGHKHIAGVKYEDITVGTGSAKPVV